MVLASEANPKDSVKNQHKLMVRYKAELAALEHRFRNQKPDLLEAQKLAKNISYDIKRRSRSRSRSPTSSPQKMLGKNTYLAKNKDGRSPFKKEPPSSKKKHAEYYKEKSFNKPYKQSSLIR